MSKLIPNKNPEICSLMLDGTSICFGCETQLNNCLQILSTTLGGRGYIRSATPVEARIWGYRANETLLSVHAHDALPTLFKIVGMGRASSRRCMPR